MAPSEPADAPLGPTTRARALRRKAAPWTADLRAADAAARLLNGAGLLTAACRDGARRFVLDTAAHGAAADGTRYLVAAPAEDAWPRTGIERPLPVSLRLFSEPPLAELRMNTVELTGSAALIRCSEHEETQLLAEGPQPTPIARALACWPGALLWRVEPLRMTLRHVHGEHLLDREALTPRAAWPSPQDELEVVELLRGAWGPHLSGIVPQLRATASLIVPFPDAPGGCSSADARRAYPVAVTDRELGLLMVDGGRRETVVVPLPHPVSSPEQFAEGLRQAIRGCTAPARG